MGIPIITLPVEEVLGEGGTYHKPGTLVFSITGPEAYKVSYGLIASILTGPLAVGPNGVATVYRCEEPNKFYATLTQAAHIKHFDGLHRRNIELSTPKITVLVEHQEKEKDKGTLHWVTNGVQQSAVEKVIRIITGDEDAEVFQVKHCPDMFHFLYKSNQQIPHYVYLNAAGNGGKCTKMLITLPGRFQPCHICGEDTHRQTACPRRRRNNDRPTNSIEEQKLQKQTTYADTLKTTNKNTNTGPTNIRETLKHRVDDFSTQDPHTPRKFQKLTKKTATETNTTSTNSTTETTKENNNTRPQQKKENKKDTNTKITTSQNTPDNNIATTSTTPGTGELEPPRSPLGNFYRSWTDVKSNVSQFDELTAITSLPDDNMGD